MPIEYEEESKKYTLYLVIKSEQKSQINVKSCGSRSNQTLYGYSDNYTVDLQLFIQMHK